MAALVEIAAGASTYRYFVTYSGIGLPLRMVGSIDATQVANRNTFIRAWFDADDRLIGFDKLVYGEIELSHRYGFSPGGTLTQASITMCGDDPVELTF